MKRLEKVCEVSTHWRLCLNPVLLLGSYRVRPTFKTSLCLTWGSQQYLLDQAFLGIKWIGTRNSWEWHVVGLSAWWAVTKTVAAPGARPQSLCLYGTWFASYLIADSSSLHVASSFRGFCLFMMQMDKTEWNGEGWLISSACIKHLS